MSKAKEVPPWLLNNDASGVFAGSRLAAGVEAIGSAGQAVSNVLGGPPLMSQIGQAATDYLMAPAAQPQAVEAAAPSTATTPPTTGATPQTTTQPTQQQAAPMASATQFKDSYTATDPLKEAQARLSQVALEGEVQKGAELGAAKAAEERVIRQQRQQDMQAMAAKDANDQMVQENRLEQMQIDERKALDDLSNTKKDPERYWKEKGTGARIAAGIAVAFGAFAASMTGMRNGALDIINSAIDRDLDAQESEIKIKRDKVDAQGNMIARFERQGASRQNARLMARQAYLEDTAMKIADKAANSPADVKQQADTQIAAIRAEADKAAAKRAEHNREFIKTQAPTTVGGNAQLPAGEAAKLGEATSAAEAVRDLNAKWKDNASGFFNWVASKLPGTNASRYENRANVAAQIVGGYLEGGKLMEQDLIRYKEMLPHAGETKETAKQKMDALVTMIANRQKGQKNALAGSGYNVSGIPNAAPTFTPK
jgi:hypothetical protein